MQYQIRALRSYARPARDKNQKYYSKKEQKYGGLSELNYMELGTRLKVQPPFNTIRSILKA